MSEIIAEIELPIYHTRRVRNKKKKKYEMKTTFVGMNYYDRLHYIQQNELKKKYERLVDKYFIKNPRRKSEVIDVFRMEYDLYYKNSACDLMNAVAVIDKFVEDGLQKSGIVINDSVKHMVNVNARVVDRDIDNPRLVARVIKV